MKKFIASTALSAFCLAQLLLHILGMQTLICDAAPVTKATEIPLLSKMNKDDLIACGIEKLSPDEQQALSKWFESTIANFSTENKEAKPLPQTASMPKVHKNKIMHGEFAITSNGNLGRFVTLDNGSTYDIPSRSRKKTMSWKVGDKVRLVEPIREINYKLENLAQKKTIGAKIADAKAIAKASKQGNQSQNK